MAIPTAKLLNLGMRIRTSIRFVVSQHYRFRTVAKVLVARFIKPRCCLRSFDLDAMPREVTYKKMKLSRSRNLTSIAFILQRTACGALYIIRRVVQVLAQSLRF